MSADDVLFKSRMIISAGFEVDGDAFVMQKLIAGKQNSVEFRRGGKSVTLYANGDMRLISASMGTYTDRIYDLKRFLK